MLHVALSLLVCLSRLGRRGRGRIVPPGLIGIAIGCALRGSSIGVVRIGGLLRSLSISIAIVIRLLIVGVVVPRGIMWLVVGRVVATTWTALGVGCSDVEC